MKSITTWLILMAAFTLMFCQGKQQTASPVSKVTATPQKAQDSMEVIGYTIHRVKLPFEYSTKDAKGLTAKYKEAWLVKLELKNMLRYPAQRVEFAIGDYIIPEYGSWEKGIYFKFYDQATFNKLEQQEIKFRLPNEKEFISTKKQFEGTASKKFSLEDERSVIGQ